MGFYIINELFLGIPIYGNPNVVSSQMSNTAAAPTWYILRLEKSDLFLKNQSRGLPGIANMPIDIH